MMRSMFSAISGLRNHQTFMDVVGNNLANVNTVGFKSSRVNFQDILTQTVRGASAEQGGRAGTNPMQIGLGTMLSGIDTLQTQGNLQSTGKSTDMAIQGDGFFVIGDGTTSYYTRDGSFDVSTDGDLVNPTSGLKVYGWTGLTTAGAVDTTQPLAPINIPVGEGMISQPSTAITLRGNINSGETDYALDATFYDSLGTARECNVAFHRTAANTWTWTATEADSGMALGAGATGNVTFDPSTGGLLTPTTMPQIALTFSDGPAAQNVTINLSGITQLASDSEVVSASDGKAPGALTTFSIGQSGDVYGVYSNGMNKLIGRIALASFRNPGGLVKLGNNMYETSPSSGDPDLGSAGSGQRGLVSTGFLEMSNVDLSREFTNIIMAERGFQANARVITTSDTMLQDLVDLKR